MYFRGTYSYTYQETWISLFKHQEVKHLVGNNSTIEMVFAVRFMLIGYNLINSFYFILESLVPARIIC